MGRKCPEPVAEKCVEILERLRDGSSLYEEVEKLRTDNMTSYAKAQVMYTLIVWQLQTSDMPTKLAFAFLLDWREEILLRGLFDNVSVPDDNKMRKVLSRLSRTSSPLWEALGHEHCTDGLSLLERIYATRDALAGERNGGDL